MIKTISFFLTLLLIALPSTAMAKNIEVYMLNKGAQGAMVFEPALIVAEPQDTITFISKDKGHNVESVKGMIPAGAEVIKSKINQDYTFTVVEPGAYLIKCTPHYAMGMVALIVVGDEPSNLDEIIANKKPNLAQKRFTAIMAELKK